MLAPYPPPDLSGRTSGQRERATALRERVRAVGPPGLTDAELAEAGTLARRLETPTTEEG